MAIHLENFVDCRSRQASFVMTNLSSLAAERRSNPSGWIATPSFVGLAMTSLCTNIGKVTALSQGFIVPCLIPSRIQFPSASP